MEDLSVIQEEYPPDWEPETLGHVFDIPRMAATLLADEHGVEVKTIIPLDLSTEPGLDY